MDIMFWLNSHHHHISILDCISWFVLIYFLKKNYPCIITWCQIWCMIETSSDLLQSSSATYGSLRKMSRNVREMFGNVHLAFGPSLENLRKSLKSGRKSSENLHKRRYILRTFYIIKRKLHGCLEIPNLFSRVEKCFTCSLRSLVDL